MKPMSQGFDPLAKEAGVGMEPMMAACWPPEET